MFCHDLGELVHKFNSDSSIPQSRKNMTATACGYVLSATNTKTLNEILVNRIVPALGKLKSSLLTTGLSKRSRINYISFYKRLIQYGIAHGLLPNKIQDTMLPGWENIAKPVKGISSGEKGWRDAMRILAKYSSYYKYEPCDLTVPFLKDFREYLEHDHGTQSWRQYYNRIVRYWMKLSEEKKVPALKWPKLPSGSKSKYGLNFENWPQQTQKEFLEYKEWCTSDWEDDRLPQYKQRLVSFEQNISTTSRIFGYAVNILSYPIKKITIELLFDEQFIRSYFNWFIKKRLRKLTVTAERTAAMLLAMARGYFKREDAISWLLKLKISFRNAKKVKNKRQFLITIPELNKVADEIRNRRLRIIENAKRKRTKPSIKNISSILRDELVFRLLIERPFRSRNIREMKLGDNLKIVDGKWRIEFIGAEMKNNHSYSISFPKELVPLLEDYLNNYRKNIYDDPSCIWVFPSPNGRHICDRTVQRIVTNNCKRVLNKHIYPHLMRDIVAHTYLIRTRDHVTLSRLLGHRDINVTLNIYGNFNADDAAKNIDEFHNKIREEETNEK